MRPQIQFVDVNQEEHSDNEGAREGGQDGSGSSNESDTNSSSDDNDESRDHSTKSGNSDASGSDTSQSSRSSSSSGGANKSSRSSSSSGGANKENNSRENNIPSLENLIVHKWKLEPSINDALKGKITVDSLKLLTDNDLQELFGPDRMDEKVRLRQKLQTWPGSAMFVAPQEGSSKQRPLQLLSSQVRASDLDELLKSNEKGKIVVKYHEKYGRLTSTLQGDLAGIIADSYIADGLKFPLPDMRKYAELIAKRFKSEIEETYFCPRDKNIKKKDPSGLIYGKYYNSKIRKELCTDTKQKRRKIDKPSKPVEFSQDQRDDQAWLKHNNTPFDLVKEKWIRTAAYRKQSIEKSGPNLQHILDDWPRFKDAEGITLIDYDYEHHNPSQSDELLKGWDRFVGKFLNYIKKIELADRSGRVLLEKIRQMSMNKCSSDYHVFKLLPVVLKPKRVGKRKLPTILDAQQDHLVHLHTANDIGPVVARLKKERDELQPTIIVVGATDTELVQFYVCKGNILWKTVSFIRCIDIVAKSTIVFGLKFSPVNELVWAFLRTHFYKESGVTHSKTRRVISLLEVVK